MTRPPMFSINAALGGLNSAVKDMAGVFWAFNGIDRSGTQVMRDARDFARAPADEAWVYSCVSKRMLAAQATPLRVQVHDGRKWRWVDEMDSPPSEAEDLQFLLDDVNPEWDGAQLKAYIEAGACIWGGSYFKKVRGRFGGYPQELHWLPVPDVEPKQGRTFIEEYDYRPQGGPVETYAARDVLAFRYVNLQDPTRPLSPLSAIREQIATNRAITTWNRATLENWGIPAGAFVTEPNEVVGPAEELSIKRILRALRGPRNRGKTPVLPFALKWLPLSLNPKDGEWIASGKVSRMTVCAALGMPLVLAGDDEKASVYASTRDAERVLWRLTMIPELDWQAVKFDSWLVPDFDPTRRLLRVRYDYSGIEALRAAPAEEMTALLQAVDRGLPFNRFIQRYSLGEDVDGGDDSNVKPEPTEVGTPRPAEYATPGMTGADPMMRSLPRDLYRHPAVRIFLDDPSKPLDVAAIGLDPTERQVLELGLVRRYSVEQLLAGVPAEGYAGLEVHP